MINLFNSFFKLLIIVVDVKVISVSIKVSSFCIGGTIVGRVSTIGAGGELVSSTAVGTGLYKYCQKKTIIIKLVRKALFRCTVMKN